MEEATIYKEIRQIRGISRCFLPSPALSFTIGTCLVLSSNSMVIIFFMSDCSSRIFSKLPKLLLLENVSIHQAFYLNWPPSSLESTSFTRMMRALNDILFRLCSDKEGQASQSDIVEGMVINPNNLFSQLNYNFKDSVVDN